MIQINSIASYEALPLEQKTELQKALRTKERLEVWLKAQNKKAGQTSKPTGAAHWKVCKYCAPEAPGECGRCHPDYPGWIWVEQERDDRDIHPSSIHKCIKNLWFSCNGYVAYMEENIEPRIRMLFDIGTGWHRIMQEFYGAKGAFCHPDSYEPEKKMDPDELNENGQPVLPLAARYRIRGSADALVYYPIANVPGMGEVVVKVVHEYKTINDGGFKKLTKPKPEHKRQATVYSAVLDAPFVVYMYSNKNDSSMVDYAVPFDNNIWYELTQKADRVLHYTHLKVMPPWEETSAVLSPYECKECPYLKLCNPPRR